MRIFSAERFAASVGENLPYTLRPLPLGTRSIAGKVRLELCQGLDLGFRKSSERNSSPLFADGNGGLKVRHFLSFSTDKALAGANDRLLWTVLGCGNQPT